MTAGSPESEAVIVVRSTSASPDEVVNTEDLFGRQEVGLPRRNKVKNGEITMVKVCIPAVGAALWSVNMQLTALLPCGNLSIYGANGKTEIAMLHPSYMHRLHPTPETEKAADMATPELMAMLDAVAR